MMALGDELAVNEVVVVTSSITAVIRTQWIQKIRFSLKLISLLQYSSEYTAEPSLHKVPQYSQLHLEHSQMVRE